MAKSRAKAARKRAPQKQASKRGTPRSRGRRAARAVLGLFGLLIALGLAFVGWLLLGYPNQAPEGTGVVRLDIPEGLGPVAMAALLAREGLIEDPELFATYLRMTRRTGPYRHGVAHFPRGAPHRFTVGRLDPNARANLRIVIPEGFDRFAIAERLAAEGICAEQDFLAATARTPAAILGEVDPEWRALDLPPVPDRSNAEGYLFPDTYQLREATPAVEVAAKLIRTWQRRMQELLDEHPDALADLGPGLRDLHDVVSLASIVEKEAARASERPIIAGVFRNRLESESFRPLHRLQADPTVSYGCRVLPALPACEGFDGRSITRAMLVDDANPYNSYRHAGLPPTPIANPGLASLAAALVPAEHDYLYFVARGDGRHRFSADLSSHNVAVESYRQISEP